MRTPRRKVVLIGLLGLGLLLLAWGAWWIWTLNPFYMPPLVRAAMHRDADAAAAAIRRGADLNRRTWVFGADNLSGWTALMWAAYRRDDRIVEMLVKAGADPNIADKTGRTALQLVFYGEGTSPSVSCVSALLAGGADPNHKRTWDGETPLFNAIRSQDVESVRALILSGADVNLADASGTTPLELAAFHYHNASIVRLLLEHGADVRGRLPNGRSWAEVAGDQGTDPEIAKAILDATTKR